MKVKVFLQSAFLLSVVAFGHYHEAYFSSPYDFGSEKYNLIYSNLPDDLPLSRLSLLAAHNSPTYEYDNVFVRCQALSPYNQLYYGNRVLDVRVRSKWNQFELVHGPVHLNRYFGTFLSEVIRFLNDHPREFVIIAIQEDADECASTMTTCEILQRYIDTFGGKDRFAIIDDFRTNTLKDVRGKIVFVGQEYFDSCSNVYNMFRCDLMMNYDVYSQIWKVYDVKWKKIKEHIYKFLDPNVPKKQCYVTFLGGNSFPVTPQFIVSGHVTPSTYSNRLSTGIVDWFGNYRDVFPDYPRTDCIAYGTCTIAYEGTNILTNDIIAPENRAGDYRGIDAIQIIATDFFGISLARHIVQIQNYRVRDWECKGNFLCIIFGPNARGFNYDFNDTLAIKHESVDFVSKPEDVETWRMNLTIAEWEEIFESTTGRKGPIFNVPGFPSSETCELEIIPLMAAANNTAIVGDVMLLKHEFKDNETMQNTLSQSKEYNSYLNSIKMDNMLRESLLTKQAESRQFTQQNFISSKLQTLNTVLKRNEVSEETTNLIKELTNRVRDNNNDKDLDSVIAQSFEIQKLIIQMLEHEFKDDEQFLAFKSQYNTNLNIYDEFVKASITIL